MENFKIKSFKNSNNFFLHHLGYATPNIKKSIIFFEILDVDNYERNLLEEVVTEDFKIFEAGEVMDIEQFHAFVTHVDPNVAPLSETSWTLSEFDISLDNNSAHVSYINRGIFKHGDEMTAKLHWMESAYLIKQAGGYKIRFLNSNVVSRDFDYK